MKIKTTELVDDALNWAVAQGEGKHHGWKHQLRDLSAELAEETS